MNSTTLGFCLLPLCLAKTGKSGLDLERLLLPIETFLLMTVSNSPASSRWFRSRLLMVLKLVTWCSVLVVLMTRLGSTVKSCFSLADKTMLWRVTRCCRTRGGTGLQQARIPCISLGSSVAIFIIMWLGSTYITDSSSVLPSLSLQQNISFKQNNCLLLRVALAFLTMSR